MFSTQSGVFHCVNSEALTAHANLWLIENIKRYRAKSVFLPAGQTPVGLYSKFEDLQPDWLKSLRLMQIDEVLTGAKRNLFQNFFREHLPTFSDQFDWIDKADTTADIAVLGFGKNGHVAFHEPHIRHPFFSGCVQLSEKTCEALELEEVTWGLTYGVEAFLKSRAILLLVDGAGKETAFQSFLSNEMLTPASRLRKHPHITVLSTIRA
jgi:6-phosphogluconolactonase/glucosamine-6-phosphate isomerase/deaminase